MSNHKDIYEFNGPVHLKEVLDWRNPRHIISVIASLVHSVKALHRDRKKHRHGSEALAPPWWKAFGYEKYKEISDDESESESEYKSESESSIFGAIYKLTTTPNSSSSEAPRCVVAFRGTIPKSYRDLKLDLSILLNKLHGKPRVAKAIEAVRGAVEEFGRDNVWIAGHSLGAAVAMLAGKEMAKEKIFLGNTFLFNPPFPSLPIEIFPSQTTNSFFRALASCTKAALALTLLEDRGEFGALAPWRPHLFVNRKDWICFGYIGYFERRQKMEDAGAGMIERLATQHSGSGLLLHAMGQKWREPMHLIPSAYVTENCNPAGNFKDDHGIRQWWKPDLQLETKEYTTFN